MPQKNEVIGLKRVFVLGQVLVLAVAMFGLFWSMALSHKQKIFDDLMAKLSASAQLMADQLKANQVPLAAGSNANGTFIIKQNDGSMVIDRRGDDAEGKKLWDRYRTKLVYEMQKQKRGWIVYPENGPFDVNQQQRFIHYLSIDELNWILAIEAPKPTELQLLAESVRPLSFWVIFAIFLFGATGLWFMTNRYFDLIRRMISDTLEDNFMHLSGEDKTWREPEQATETVEKPSEELPAEQPFEKQIVDIRHDEEKERSVPAVSSIQSVVLDALMQFKKPPVKASAQEQQPAAAAHSSPAQQPEELSYAREPLPPVDGPGAAKDLSIDMGNIKSPVLKKMIRQFREK